MHCCTLKHRGSVKNNMTHVALRGRGTTSAYNCFPATGLFIKFKFFASVERGSTETTRLQHASSVFGDTNAIMHGGDLATAMATWLSSSLRNKNCKLKIFVVGQRSLLKAIDVEILENAWTIFCPFQAEDTSCKRNISWFHETRLHFPFCFLFGLDGWKVRAASCRLETEIHQSTTGTRIVEST